MSQKKEQTMRRIMLMTALAVILYAGNLAIAQDAPKIAVARAGRIANEMQEMKDFRQRMENEQKALQAQLRERQEKVRALKDARDQLKPDAPQFQDRNKEFLQEALNVNVWQQLMQAELERNIKVSLKSFWDRVESSVGEVAKAKGIEIVISDNRPEIPADLDQIKLEQLQQIIGQRDVLYADAKVDISDEVIALLDKKYKEGAK